MSGEALYERYKDALRRGHVASLRGRLEEALTAYAEAAAIAPERATPHTAAGTALMRRKRPADAVRHFSAAVRLAPRDEGALVGRAQALAATDRRAEAANAYDAVAEVQAANRKLADAVDSARRGLELAEGRERRRTLVKLMDRLRASDPGEPGRVALERALVVLEGRAIEPRKATAAPAGGVAKAQPSSPKPAPPVAPSTTVAQPVTAVEPASTAGSAAASGSPLADESVAPAAPAPAAAVDSKAEAVRAARAAIEWPEADIARTRPAEPAQPQPVPDPEPSLVPAIYRGPLDRDLPADLDLDALSQSVEQMLEPPGDWASLERLLDLASGYRQDGRADAALDTCYVALSIAPDDIGLHLALVELYDERGWTSLASEKLDLLDRLTGLDGVELESAMVAGARAARG
ncbi:MAG TPA: hypothetical protein VGM28_04400 [Candidatus Limnocylindrales bacterium]